MRERIPLTQRPAPRKAFLLLAAVLSIGLVAASGLSIAGIRYYDSRLTKVPVGDHCERQSEDCIPDIDPECLRNACTYLFLGSDTREGLTEEQEVAFGSEDTVTGQRADVIILVHEDPNLNRTVVLHIPRDLRVELPGGPDKINKAFEDGPNAMVQAVEDLTGLSVNHYISVNFSGFIRLVNALGGVPICIDRPMIDTLSNLNLPEAGCYDLSGGPALAFVRARHIQGDAIPDFSRISRQQQFIRAVINKLLSPGSTLHLPSLIDAAQDNLVIDENLNLYDLRDFTDKLAEIGQEGVTFRVTPSVPVVIDDVSYLELVQPRARQLFYRIRTGKDLGAIGKQTPLTPVSPADVTVRLYDDGSGGEADEVAEYLKQAGFVVIGPYHPPPSYQGTQLLYGPAYGKQQAVVASYLPLVPVVFVERNVPGADITVVIGSDFEGIVPG